MELLAPAGNLRQAYTAIDSGCNALYGGIKDWSARNRAENYTLEEYKRLLKYCHDRNVKFYLTINTLLDQSELEALKTVMRSEEFIAPDAIIVADFGVISFLKEEFPEIPLHASTQFGAYCLEDVIFLQNMGFERVVLARELSLEELSVIRKGSTVELEIFVYGAQCISFSGNCLWGGLFRLGSGNRGRCIGMCDDAYLSDDNTEKHFFHLHRISLENYLDKLNEIGIDSFKIEGRLRPETEIREVVTNFRAIMDNGEMQADRNGFCYTGRFAGQPQPDNLAISDDLARYKNILFTNYISSTEANIRLKMLYSGKSLIGIDYVNSNGERMNITLSEQSTRYSVSEIYSVLRENIDGNIYEFISENKEHEFVYSDEKQLREIVQIINEDIRKSCEVFKGNNVKVVPAAENVIAVDRCADLCKLMKSRFNRFLFEIHSLKELKKVIDIENSNENLWIMYKLPFLDFTGMSGDIYSLLQGRKVMISRISQLIHFKNSNCLAIYADYTVNIWNIDAAKYLVSMGIDGIIAHPECKLSDLKMMEEAIDVLYIQLGKVPLGYTRACYRNEKLCESGCNGNVMHFQNVKKGYQVQVLCNNEYGYRTIISSQLFSGHLRKNASNLLVSYSCLTDDEKSLLFEQKSEGIYMDVYRKM